jgi:pSer/pThr/pTyr-binding forkhead associated (FHA) protein
MSLTLVVRSARRGAVAQTPDPELTFDTPRLVIGRGEGCELRLPDPSVSSRHASIRQRGTEHILLDEGSTNGTFLLSAAGPGVAPVQVKLSPQSPRVVRTGDLVRLGRVWLELRFDAAMPNATSATAKELALELVARALAAAGEDARPRLRCVQGPDVGKELRLAESGRHYLVGRAKDLDLSLEDEDASRRHFDVVVRGDRAMVCDLGSKGGTALGDVPLEGQPLAWKPGARLYAGGNVFTLELAAVEALGELERSPDEPLRPGDAPAPPIETPEPPPVEPSSEEPEEPAPGEPDEAPVSAPLRRRAPDAERAPEPRSEEPTWGIADGAVMLIALGVLVISVVGLIWLLRR